MYQVLCQALGMPKHKKHGPYAGESYRLRKENRWIGLRTELVPNRKQNSNVWGLISKSDQFREGPLLYKPSHASTQQIFVGFWRIGRCLQVRKAEETPHAKALHSERDSVFRDVVEVCKKCDKAQAVKWLILFGVQRQASEKTCELPPERTHRCP